MEGLLGCTCYPHTFASPLTLRSSNPISHGVLSAVFLLFF